MLQVPCKDPSEVATGLLGGQTSAMFVTNCGRYGFVPSVLQGPSCWTLDRSDSALALHAGEHRFELSLSERAVHSHVALLKVDAIARAEWVGHGQCDGVSPGQ